tara:strand:- start:1672 stop:2490 length:819 start_codon:yes stop_codon:yes gene_type:complete
MKKKNNKIIKIIPCNKKIGAEIVCNLKSIKKKQIKLIKNSLNAYGMVFFRNQNLDSQSYIKFAKKFGNIAHYPMLKGLSLKFPQITVVERKISDKGPSFGEQFHTDSSYTKKPPKFTMLLARLVPNKGIGNTEFASQYLAYEKLPKIYKKKIENLKAVFSSSGPISITRLEREKERGTGKSKDFKAVHKIVKKINKRKAIYCSPGHVENFLKTNVNEEKKIKNFLFKHQIKKKFVFEFEWEKNSLAIWDNRSMLHQATPYNGNRIMHRITIK